MDTTVIPVRLAVIGAGYLGLAAPCLLVGKSTVPVGTARRVRDQIRALAPVGCGVDLAWNPEFLREGTAAAGAGD